MALSTEYTSEQNYSRIFYATTVILAEGLREIFKQEWDNQYKSTKGEWKDDPRNGMDFYNGESSRNRKRYARFLAIIKNGDRKEWDCLTLFYAILSSDSLKPGLGATVRKNVDDLRHLRNECAHFSGGILSDIEFHAAISKLHCAFQALGLPTVKIQDIKNKPFPLSEDFHEIMKKEFRQAVEDYKQELQQTIELKQKTEELFRKVILDDQAQKKFLKSQTPLLPSEIRARGPKAMLAYENALKTGRVKVYRARIMFIGQDRAGKTSLKNSFLGLSFDPKQQSTDGIELDLSKFEVDVDQVSKWKRTDEKQGVSKFVPSLVRMVAGKLEQEETEVDPAQYEKKEKTVVQSVGFVGPGPREPEKQEALMDPKRQVTLAEDKSQISQGTTEKGGEGKIEAAAIPELKIDPSLPPEEFTELLVQHLEGLNLDNDTSAVEHHMDLDLWDFAGQHLYYTFCPVFFSWRAVYLLVYNLSKGLNEIAMPCFRRGFFNIPLENSNRQTNLENLLSWLVTLNSVCSSKPEANERTPSVSALLYTRPPVFIVGTHADTKQDQDVKEMELQITKEISEKDYESHVIRPFFSVDNTQGSSDEGVAALQKKIIEVLKKEPYMGEEIPLRWFNFEKVVQALAAENVHYLKLDQLKVIIRKFCYIENEDDVVTLLDYYHDIGKIVRHQNTVVLRAKWLIDIFKKLVTICPFDDSEPNHSKLWKQMERTGVLDMELVNHVFCNEFHQYKDDILDMMEQFGLIAKFTKSPGKDVYLVPCQLRTPPDALGKIEPLSSDPCTLYLCFLGSFVPYGFFSQLVSRCVTWCCPAGSELPNLFDGASRLFIGNEQNHQLILVYKKRYIKIILNELKRDDSPFDGAAKLQDVAIKVRKFLEHTMQTISHDLSGFKNLAYELCVECPLCLKEPKKCDIHSQFSCPNEYCMCLLKVAVDGSFECCRKSFDRVKPKLPQLQMWFPVKDMSQEDVRVPSGSKRKASCSTSQIPKRIKPTVKPGTPTEEELEWLSQKIGARWKPLGRRLLFVEAELTAFTKDNPDEFSEKVYQMLLRWKSRDGKDATYQVLYDALDHDLVQQKLLAEKICFD